MHVIEYPPGVLLDLTRASRRWGQLCGTTAGEWLCTRASGHSGRCAAGDGRHVLAVWSTRPAQLVL